MKAFLLSISLPQIIAVIHLMLNNEELNNCIALIAAAHTVVLKTWNSRKYAQLNNIITAVFSDRWRRRR